MDSWLEALKLVVPFAVALTAIWTKEWYVAKREKKILMELMWRELVTQVERLRGTIETFGRIPGKLKEDGFCVFIFQMTESYFATASRLAQLDAGNTFVYSNFFSMAKHIEASSLNLQKLLQDVIKADDASRERYEKAVQKNVAGLQREFIAFAETCIQVMRTIGPNIEGRDNEAISRAESSLSQARELLPAK